MKAMAWENLLFSVAFPLLLGSALLLFLLFVKLELMLFSKDVDDVNNSGDHKTFCNWTSSLADSLSASEKVVDEKISNTEYFVPFVPCGSHSYKSIKFKSGEMLKQSTFSRRYIEVNKTEDK
jgi:hypothetical protein